MSTAVTVVAGAGSARAAKVKALLQPGAVDLWPLLGAGRVGQVRGLGTLAVKVAHGDARSIASLQEERVHLARLQDPAWGVAVPRLWGWRNNGTALLRDRVQGTPLLALLQDGPLKDTALGHLWNLLRAVLAYRERWGVMLDFTPPNLCLGAGGFVLVDAGLRRAPSPFVTLDGPAALAGALQRYLRWRTQRGRAELLPTVLPPSGFMHVGVPVGAVRGAKVLWRNTALMGELALPWTDTQLLGFCNLATHARSKTTLRPATRYQDTPTLGPAAALGDGRSIHLGQLEGGAHGRRDVMLKGCGRTPLAWKGHRYHQDGFVSFPRTLWETSVCEELARLGFETPRVLAVLSTGKSTVDNTKRRWPAAAAVRVADTQLRLGHLVRWSGDRAHLHAALHHVGTTTLRADFNPRNATHLRALLDRFAQNLGTNAGRSDALNIHGFNPTLGNVRVDGHFIDFSTVRFFRHHLPDFRYLNMERRVASHAAVWRTFVVAMARVLGAADVWEPGSSARARSAALLRYNRAYRDAFLGGVAMFLGLGPDWMAGLSSLQRRSLVKHTQALRALRCGAHVDLAFWKQRCAAPLFDLEGQAPALMHAWRRHEKEPWRALLSEFSEDAVPTGAARVAARWEAAVRSTLDAGALASAAPRAWHHVVRPDMEAEALADLCYARSTPEDHEAWSLSMAAARHLPPGQHTQEQARAYARRLVHVRLAGVLPHHHERVAGLTPELHRAMVSVFRNVLGSRLVGVVAHGSRVMTWDAVRRTGHRQKRAKGRHLREGGPDPAVSSDLDLKVFVRAGWSGLEKEATERALGQALAALPAWFPLGAHRPPRQRILVTGQANVRAAFFRYNGAERMRLQGKPPIPAVQAVVLMGAEEDPTLLWEQTLDAVAWTDASEGPPGCERVPLSAVRKPRDAHTGVALDVHALATVLEEQPELDLPAVRASRHAGRWSVTEHGGIIHAALRAGRTHVWLRPT